MVPKTTFLPVVLACALFLCSPAFCAEVRVVLIPVSFSDCAISHTENEIRSRASEAEAYFSAQLADSFSICVSPTAVLKNKLSYYGANSLTEKDVLIREAVADACVQVNPKVDFSRIDHIVLLAAGPSEADGAGEDKIWPQASRMGQLSFLLDGRKTDDFGVCCEIAPDGKSLAGIGDLCHELGHLLGLKDLYDVIDGEGGTLSLMDRGNRLDDGNTPSLLSAIDLQLLGKGEEKTLTPGKVTIPVRGEKQVYFKLAPQVNAEEFFLFECRRPTGQDRFIDGDGLIVYHVDRSDADAGWSSLQGRSLTAAQRWEFNEVNCNPEHLCAARVSDSDLTFRDGASDVVIRNVRDLPDGGVGFDVLKAIIIKELKVFQNAAILSWESGLDPNEITESCVQIKADGSEWEEPAMTGNHIRMENLVPGSGYTIRITLVNSSGQTFSTEKEIRTAAVRKGTWPFIFLQGVERNEDLSFKKNARIPLVLYNPDGVTKVEWHFNGKPVDVGEDGWWHIPGSGTLRATATREGKLEILEKTINVK